MTAGIGGINRLLKKLWKTCIFLLLAWLLHLQILTGHLGAHHLLLSLGDLRIVVGMEEQQHLNGTQKRKIVVQISLQQRWAMMSSFRPIMMTGLETRIGLLVQAQGLQ